MTNYLKKHQLLKYKIKCDSRFTSVITTTKNINIFTIKDINVFTTKNIDIFVGVQGCPNSLDLDTFTMIDVEAGDKFPPELLEYIDQYVVNNLKEIYQRDDVETNIVFVTNLDKDNKVVIWSNKGPADGANLIPLTFDYWNSDIVCPIIKTKRSAIMGILESFKKLVLSLLKTSHYNDLNQPNRYAEGKFRNLLQHLVKHATLENYLELFSKEIDFTKLFDEPDYNNENRLLDIQQKEEKTEKLKIIKEKKTKQIIGLQKKLEICCCPKKKEKFVNLIINLDQTIKGIDETIYNLLIPYEGVDRIYWAVTSGCKKIAFQLVKASLLILGYENFTKEIDIPIIDDLPFIHGMIPTMNRKVKWYDELERKEALALMEQSKNFVCSAVRALSEKYPELKQVQGKNYNPSRDYFYKEIKFANKPTEIIEIEHSKITEETPIIGKLLDLPEKVWSDLEKSPCYEKCKFVDTDISDLLVTICSKCHTVTRMKDLPIQSSYKNKTTCLTCS